MTSVHTSHFCPASPTLATAQANLNSYKQPHVSLLRAVIDGGNIRAQCYIVWGSSHTNSSSRFSVFKPNGKVQLHNAASHLDSNHGKAMPDIFFTQLESELRENSTALSSVALARKEAASLNTLLTNNTFSNASLQQAIKKALTAHVEDVRKRYETTPHAKRARADSSGGMQAYLVDSLKAPSERRAIAVMVAVTAHVPFRLFDNPYHRLLTNNGNSRECVLLPLMLCLSHEHTHTHTHTIQPGAFWSATKCGMRSTLCTNLPSWRCRRS
jgi:hypothetical protein